MSQLSRYNGGFFKPSEFLRDVKQQKKIYEYDGGEAAIALSFVMNKAAVLSGLKDDPDLDTKADVYEMLGVKYKHLAIEEIEFAFKANRYNLTHEFVNHYNLFNAEYVSRIIDNYLLWKTSEQKKSYGKPVVAELPSADERSAGRARFYVTCYQNYLEEGQLTVYGLSACFDGMIDDGILKKYHENKEEYDTFLADARDRFLRHMDSEKRSGDIDNYRRCKNKIQSVLDGKKDHYLPFFKEIYLEYFFGKMKRAGKTVDEFRNFVETKIN